MDGENHLRDLAAVQEALAEGPLMTAGIDLEPGHFTEFRPDRIPEEWVIPPAPEMGPHGDKTEAYVDYMFQYFPEVAAKKYAGRKTHRTP